MMGYTATEKKIDKHNKIGWLANEFFFLHLLLIYLWLLK